jgi:hypothetical protein
VGVKGETDACHECLKPEAHHLEQAS